MNTPPFAADLRARKCLIGMVHVQALPGTPANCLDVEGILRLALDEATLYRDCGVQTVLVENMHDAPYTRSVGPEVTAVMTRVAAAVRGLGLRVGVQILAGANREALACALAAQADFIRVEGYAYAHIADEGLIEACAGDLLRYRRAIGAEHIAVLADVKKKHCAHAITADVGLEETARTAQYFRADGVIVTGTATGVPTAVDDVASVRRSVTCPVLVGSGVTAANLVGVLAHADAVIVGSALKEDGHWSGRLSRARVTEMLGAFTRAVGG